MRVGKVVLVALPLLWPATLQAQFMQQGNKLVGGDAVSGSRQGSGVAISGDGNTAISGGFVDGNGVEASWIFTRTNGFWNQQGPKLVGSGAAHYSNTRPLPVNVAISSDGNSVMVGSHDDNGAWVFARHNGVWGQQGPKLVGSAPGYPAVSAVALSGDGSTALVGNPFAANGEVLGSTWVFTGPNGVWSKQTQLVGTGYIAGDQCPVNQGSSVALSYYGQTALVGAPGDNNCKGAAWLFSFDEEEGTWNQWVKLVGTGGSTEAQQGFSVAISGDGSTVLTAGSDGEAWVFTQNFGPWTQQAMLVGLIGSVALSYDGNTAVVGGSVFARSNGIWTSQINLGAGSVAISADASTAMIGTPADNGGVGAASVFVQPVATHFSVSAPASVTAGVPFNFTVAALDGNNNPVARYSGGLYLRTSDPEAVLPNQQLLLNGANTFSATFFNVGNQLITANGPFFSPSFTGSSGTIAVTGGISGTAPLGVVPSGAVAGHLFLILNYFDPRSTADLDVVNVLINNSLDGRNACYLAYSIRDNTVYLVADNGALLPLLLNGQGGVSNNQCMIQGQFSSASIADNELTLTLNLTFNAAFGGNKIVYMAARDFHGGNSGWQPLGVWQAPFSFPGSIIVSSLLPSRLGGPVGTFQTFTATIAGRNGAGDIGIVDFLVNNSLDGRQACYLAYVPATNTIFLVDDAGDAGGPFADGMALNGSSATIQNGQCIVNGAQSTVARSDYTLAITLSVAFKGAFAGHRILWVAGRDGAGGNNTGWQAVGTVTVQQ